MSTTTDRRFDTATLSVDRATDPQRRACRMLLPESATWAWPAEYLVAMGDSPAQLLGALAYTPTLLAGAPSWFFSLRVIRTHRRRGIGRRLIDALIDRAGSGGIPLLISHVDSGSGPEMSALLRGSGFRPGRTVTTFEGDIDLERYESHFRPICDRLQARGKVPTDLRIVSLKEAPLDGVSLLYAENLGGTIDGVELFLRRALARGGLDASFAMMVGGRVLGLHLLEVHESVVLIRAKIVAKEFRGRWVNAFLSREFAGRLRACGMHRVRFTAADDVHYTLKFAERQSVGIVNVATQFIREL